MPLRKLKGLKARLLIIVLLAMLPVLCLALFMAMQDYREAKTSAVENCRQLTRSYAAAGTALFERARMLLTQMAELPGVQAMDKAACARVLAALDPQHITYRSVNLIRPDGVLISSSLPQHRQTNLSSHEWFKEALRTKAFVVGRYQTDSEAGGPELPLAQPLLAPDGSVRLALNLTLNLASLADLLDDDPLPRHAAASIIDQSGTILARFPDDPRAVGQNAPGADSFLPELLRQGQDTWESQGVDGVPRIYFLAPLIGQNDRALFVRVGMPKEAVFAVANRNLQRNLGFIGIMTALVLVSTWFFSNALVLRHIQKLWLATKRLTEGNYAHRIGPTGGGELGELALAFDHMAGALEFRTTQLVRAEQNYRTIFENSITGIFQTTPEGRIHIANQALADILGYQDPVELKERVQDVAAQIYSDPRQRREVFARLEREGTISGMEVPARRVDGSTVWLSIDARVIRDKDGKVTRCEGMAADITLRKRVEQELKLKQEKLQGLLEHSPALISIKDAQGRYILSNRMHQEVHGMGQGADRTVEDVFPPEVARKIREEDRQVLLENKPLTFQRPVPTVAGERHFMSVKFPLYDDRGRPDRVCSISYDVTDLEQIREALRQSEEKYRTMIQTSPDLIWMIDPVGVLVEVNSASRELIGYAPEELRGRHFHQFFYPEDLREHDRELVLSQFLGRRGRGLFQPKLINERRQMPRSTRNLNLRLIPKGGEQAADANPRSFELSACGLWQDMKFLGTIVVIRDVTERRQAEVALRESQELLRQTQGMARIGGWSLNLDSGARSWTEEACRLLGVAGREIPDFRDHLDFLAPEDRAVFAEALKRAEGLGEGFDLELRQLQGGGTQGWIRIMARRVDADGARILSGMVQDITDRKNLELLRNDIDSIIRHDLKAPLNGIINLPQIMRGDSNLTASQVEFLQFIEDSGRTMLRQIDMSLDLMKIERGQYVLQPVTFDLLSMLQDILSTLRDSAEVKRVRVELLVRGAPVPTGSAFWIRGEERLCYPMLTNLVVNALEASPAGETVRIDLEEDRYSVVRIRNAGVIPEEIRGRFFEKYVTSGKTTGTGLGTYSARLFARAQGGGIELDTSEAGATTLIVRLPRG